MGHSKEWMPLQLTPRAGWNGSLLEISPDGHATIFTTSRVLHNRQLSRTEMIRVNPVMGKNQTHVRVTAKDLQEEEVDLAYDFDDSTHKSESSKSANPLPPILRESLKQLKLNANFLSSVPKSIMSVHLIKLEKLDLLHNHLAISVPIEIDTLRNLTELN